MNLKCLTCAKHFYLLDNQTDRI